MYKDPQLSAQAKRLRTELEKRGAALTHAQALEVVAQLQGHRTVHVAQAKNNAPVDIRELALKQAAELAFETLGRFEGNVLGLVASIRAAFALDDQGSRFVEAAVHDIFETKNAPKVSALFDYLQLGELPDMFDKTVAKLTATLEAQARAPKAPAPADNSVYEALVYDWRLADGTPRSDIPEDQQMGFDLRVTRNTYQLFVDMVPQGHTPQDVSKVMQMSLFIEINEGRPCVHMTNDVYGDQVLTVFFTEDGLYLRPDDSERGIRTGRPRGAALQKLEKDLESPFGMPTPWNVAFIETP